MISPDLTKQLHEKLQKLRSYRDSLKESLANERFQNFFNLVWSQALTSLEGRYVPGTHINDWCDELQGHKFTSKESARKHAKSEILHAFEPWKFHQRKRSVEAVYFSYKQELAAYHVGKIKKAMLEIPEFQGVQWLSDAESVIRCKWPGTKIRLEITPAGIKSFKRGWHPDDVLCDDILKDPTQRKLNVAELQDLAIIFYEQVLSMPKEGGSLHCWGTSQDPTDLFHQNRKRRNFHCSTVPAIFSRKRHKVLWPEMFPWERLEEIEGEIGAKAFGKEFLCRPVRGEEGYFKLMELEAIIDGSLVQADPERFESEHRTIGGFDIGKKRNPSHLAVFLDDGEVMRQIFSKWLDGWDYTEQVEYLKFLIDKLGIEALQYDNSRAEFESYAEQGQLPECMEGVVLTGKKKFEIAALLESRVRAKPKPRIALLTDDRQRNQILAVDNDLHAPETPEGHGDSFWSCALACGAAEGGSGDYVN